MRDEEYVWVESVLAHFRCYKGAATKHPHEKPSGIQQLHDNKTNAMLFGMLCGYEMARATPS